MDFFELKKMVDCGLPPSDLIVLIFKALIFPCHYKKNPFTKENFSGLGEQSLTSASQEQNKLNLVMFALNIDRLEAYPFTCNCQLKYLEIDWKKNWKIIAL